MTKTDVKIKPEHVLLRTYDLLLKESPNNHIAKEVYSAITAIADTYGKPGGTLKLPLLYLPQLLQKSEQSLRTHFDLTDEQISYIKGKLSDLGYSLSSPPSYSLIDTEAMIYACSRGTEGNKDQARESLEQLFEFGLSLHFKVNAEKTRLGETIVPEVTSHEDFEQAVQATRKAMCEKHGVRQTDESKGELYSVIKSAAEEIARKKMLGVLRDAPRDPTQAAKKAREATISGINRIQLFPS